MTYPDTPGFVRGSNTSWASAQALAAHVNGLRKIAFDIIVDHPNGITDERLDKVAGRTGSLTLRPRRVELMQLGLVTDSGRTEENESGKDAVLWIISTRKRKIPIHYDKTNGYAFVHVHVQDEDGTTRRVITRRRKAAG